METDIGLSVSSCCSGSRNSTFPALHTLRCRHEDSESCRGPESVLLLLCSEPGKQASLPKPSPLTSTTSRLLCDPASCSSARLFTQNPLLQRQTPVLATRTLPLVSGRSLLSRSTQGAHVGHVWPPVCGAGAGTSLHRSEDVDMTEEEQEEQEEYEEEEEEEEEEGSMSAMFVSPAEEEETEAEVMKQEFEELKRDKEEQEEQIKDMKYQLLNHVCCSLVNKSKSPGEEDWDSEESVWTRIMDLAKDVSEHNPQFLLKVAVYTRQELNIRITANFLLALAANLSSTKSHVRRYLCAAVQLPSDWLEVVRIYSTCFSRSLPSCLKKGLSDKFKDFTEYQLSKYNTRKHRCKHNRKSCGKKPSEKQLTQWANLIRAEPAVLRSLVSAGA
uniref:TROVE domain-containing protein n=1 Tax=Knipowitschia caucasica TaxID=637954 RepID=A0AAV2K054_KNICA